MLNIDELKTKLTQLRLIDKNGKPVSYSAFKNMATISRYGKKYKVVFIGIPKDNLFGFYTMYGTDPIVLKEAYSNFISIVKGDIEPYTDKDVQWGNSGIPISYSNLKVR